MSGVKGLARNTRRIPMAGIGALTERERQVLGNYMREPNAKIAARQMGVSYQTYKNHITSILAKLNVERFGQAVVLYERERNSEPPERRWHDRRELADRRIQQAGSGHQGQGRATPVSAPPDPLRRSA